MNDGTNNSIQFHAAHGVAGLILLALAVIFGAHFLGFRFVAAAGVGR